MTQLHNCDIPQKKWRSNIMKITSGYDEIKEVRTSTINSLVKIIQEVGINHILSKLLKNLSDEGTIEIQRSIALILGRTAQYEDEQTKKRVISLLKIRCEMSQDPIICSTFQKLKEG